MAGRNLAVSLIAAGLGITGVLVSMFVRFSGSYGQHVFFEGKKRAISPLNDCNEGITVI
jgi:hypothetical protein